MTSQVRAAARCSEGGVSALGRKMTILQYALLVLSLSLLAASLVWAADASAQTISVSFPATRAEKPLDGRLLLLLSNDPSDEPRMQIDDSIKSQMIFGVTVDGWKPGEPIAIGDDAQAIRERA